MPVEIVCSFIYYEYFTVNCNKPSQMKSMSWATWPAPCYLMSIVGRLRKSRIFCDVSLRAADSNALH